MHGWGANIYIFYSIIVIQPGRETSLEHSYLTKNDDNDLVTGVEIDFNWIHAFEKLTSSWIIQEFAEFPNYRVINTNVKY